MYHAPKIKRKIIEAGRRRNDSVHGVMKFYTFFSSFWFCGFVIKN